VCNEFSAAGDSGSGVTGSPFKGSAKSQGVVGLVETLPPYPIPDQSGSSVSDVVGGGHGSAFQVSGAKFLAGIGLAQAQVEQLQARCVMVDQGGSSGPVLVD
jgi:hypothetical protein